MHSIDQFEENGVQHWKPSGYYWRSAWAELAGDEAGREDMYRGVVSELERLREWCADHGLAPEVFETITTEVADKGWLAKRASSAAEPAPHHGEIVPFPVTSHRKRTA